MIAGVLGEQLVAEPQYLRFVGDVTGMAGDLDAGRGLARAMATVSAMVSGCKSQAATEQPWAASWRVSSRPMPEPPPVTTASFPVNESMTMMLTAGAGSGQRSTVPGPRGPGATGIL